MTVEQIVDIPADYRIFLELPRSVPAGVKARVQISIPVEETEAQNDSISPSPDGIEEIRKLLQKEMAEKGTLAVKTESGDGWEAHVMEKYAEP